MSVYLDIVGRAEERTSFVSGCLFKAASVVNAHEGRATVSVQNRGWVCLHSFNRDNASLWGKGLAGLLPL